MTPEEKHKKLREWLNTPEFNENLLVYLDEINSQSMIERHGKEKLIKSIGVIDIVHSEYNGFRYLQRNHKKEIVGCFQGVLYPKEIISNIYVRPDYRRKGAGKRLYKYILRDMPTIKFSENKSKSGFLFTLSMQSIKIKQDGGYFYQVEEK